MFENRHQSAIEVFTRALGALKEWESAQPIKQNPNPKSLPITRDTVGYPLEIICNTDASWKGGTRSAGLAWIFTDFASEELYRGSSAQNFVSSPCMAEALAIREALLQGASLNYRHICIKSDSQVLVLKYSFIRSLLSDDHRNSSGFSPISTTLAFSSSSSFLSCRYTFIPRSLNGPADGLAKSCLPAHLISSPPIVT
uniref:RNase H type-1 domain-containing protein n=2 Tax=Brassica oleracea TaxID=3712 RepID=A0A3P6CFE5_BRAOL|nr:unnamed protein product [Brassica oleracea]